MGSTEKVKVAIIGFGAIGQRHAKSAVACPDITLLCLVDPAPNAQVGAAVYNVPLYPSVQEMLALESPDAAIICAPNRQHVIIGQELLRAGINVLVEKPVSTTIVGGKDLIETARRCGKQLLVGHHRRFNPFVTAAKNALTDGVVGRPIAVCGIWATFKPDSYFKKPFEWRAEIGSGGVILINLVHEVDTLQYLLGPIVRVHAEQTISQRMPTGNVKSAEEGAAILLRFSSGVVGTFILSDATPSQHNFESATGENPIIPKAGRDIYRIFGTDGTLSVGDMTVQKYGTNVEKSWTNQLEGHFLSTGKDIPFDEQANHFARVVKGQEKPRCSGEDGLRAVIVCDAVKRAIAEGGPVDIRTSKL